MNYSFFLNLLAIIENSDLEEDMKKSTILAKKELRKKLREDPQAEENKILFQERVAKKQREQEKRRRRRKKLQSRTEPENPENKDFEEEVSTDPEETTAISSSESEPPENPGLEKEKRPPGSVAGRMANNTFLKEIDRLRLQNEIGLKKAAAGAGLWKHDPVITARLKEFRDDAKRRAILNAPS